MPQYSDMNEFSQPSGVVDVQLDKVTNRLATPTCPDDYVSAFVAGTEPRDTCETQAGMKGFFSRMFGSEKPVMPVQASSGGQNPGMVSDPKKKGFLETRWNLQRRQMLGPPFKPADGSQTTQH